MAMSTAISDGTIFQYELVFVVRLILSAVLGGMIGLERERRRRSAGFRTHILVTMGACIFMLVSIAMPAIIDQMPNGIVNNADPGRIAAQVVSGIGFLGAGAIMQDRGRVHGLTTAASLWVVAAIGLAVGAGLYLTAISSTLMLWMILSWFSTLESRAEEFRRQFTDKKEQKSGTDTEQEVEVAIGAADEEAAADVEGVQKEDA